MRAQTLTVLGASIVAIAIPVGLSQGASPRSSFETGNPLAACVNRTSGAIRAVPGSRACRPSEARRPWLSPSDVKGLGLVGPPGADGADGSDGADGVDGADGTYPTILPAAQTLSGRFVMSGLSTASGAALPAGPGAGNFPAAITFQLPLTSAPTFQYVDMTVPAPAFDANCPNPNAAAPAPSGPPAPGFLCVYLESATAADPAGGVPANQAGVVISKLSVGGGTSLSDLAGAVLSADISGANDGTLPTPAPQAAGQFNVIHGYWAVTG
jgi:hypothetical protein